MARATASGIALLSLFLYGCPAGCGVDDTPDVHFEVEYGQIRQITVDGANILVGGGCYIIGSCDGADTPAQRVTSSGVAHGGMLRAEGSCKPSPFQFKVLERRDTSLVVRWSVGPLRDDYATLSVPCDGAAPQFSSYAALQPSHELGCANRWTSVAFNQGLFAGIPTPCRIPHGDPDDTSDDLHVGQAMFRNPAPVAGEISGVYTLRRTVRVGPTNQLAFTRHPFTHNIEPGWDALPEGTTVRLVEEIIVK